MQTLKWGPGAWEFLHTITFNYPERIDDNDPDHIERRKYTKQLFENLQYTLPCKYCRESFKQFLKELPIEGNLESREKITYWFYEMHNKVNNKLRKQEQEAVDAKLEEYATQVEEGKMSRRTAMRLLEKFAKETMITQKDPPFSKVCAKYESYRAGCSKAKNKMATCRSK
jgi:hypothetical protein